MKVRKILKDLTREEKEKCEVMEYRELERKIVEMERKDMTERGEDAIGVMVV